jgi:hypothetical protein
VRVPAPTDPHTLTPAVVASGQGGEFVAEVFSQLLWLYEFLDVSDDPDRDTDSPYRYAAYKLGLQSVTMDPNAEATPASQVSMCTRWKRYSASAAMPCRGLRRCRAFAFRHSGQRAT